MWLTLFFNTKLQSTGLRITAGAIKARISLKRTAEVFEKNSRIFFGRAWLILSQGRCLLRPLFCYCLNLWYFHRSSKLGVWWLVGIMAIEFSTTRATIERVQVETIHVRASRAVFWGEVAAFVSVQEQHQLIEEMWATAWRTISIAKVHIAGTIYKLILLKN